MIGPLHLLAIGFDEDKRARDIIRIVNDLVQAQAIRIFDLLYITKHSDGGLKAKEISELRTDDQREYGALIRRLIGLTDQDVERMEPGELADSLRVAEYEFGLSESEILTIADRIPEDTSGILAIFEHTWARGAKTDFQKSGGTVRAQGLIDPKTLEFAADELTTILDSIGRAESSAMDELVEVKVGAEAKVEAARAEAADAIATSEAGAKAAGVEQQAQEIEAKAVLRAMNALVTAQVIEKKAARHALETIIAANVLEATAVQEAAKSLISG